MHRRDAIKKVALLLGGTLSAPTLMALHRLEQPTISNTEESLFTLTASQKAIVAEIAEMILPKTHTVGAKEVGVPAFIEMMMKDCYEQPDQASFMEGVMAMAQIKFLDMDAPKRSETLRKLELDTKEGVKTASKGTPFWRLMKELTLLGYFTSEAGIKASFEYVPIPTKLEVIKLKPNQKAYAN